MTYKRYYEKNYEEQYYIFDSKTLSEKEFEKKVEYDGYDVFADSLTSKEVVDLLNENEELKRKYYNEIMEEGVKIERLRKENEELKNKIDALEDDNETYHKSLEKLNLYTKRFIPTKCTNEFKDCKTNRYYWLDQEGNFEGCLELLNLLDCENEVLKSENHHLKGRLMEYEKQIKGDEV